jgi:GTPase SAR1 family protein
MGITSYKEIDVIIDEFKNGIIKTLEHNLVGLYLTGSLSYDDFVPGRSDLDFQVVVKLPLSPTEIIEVEKLHQYIEDTYPTWSKRIECSYTPQSMLSHILPPTDPRPWWGAGIMYPKAPYGNEWIINQYQLYAHAIALIGPDYKSLTKAINIQDVQKACVRDLFQEWEPKIQYIDSLDSHNRSYIVLNLCRIVYTVSKAEVASKKVSATWVKSTFPLWKDLIETAERWVYDTEMGHHDETKEFIRFVVGEVRK